MHHAMGFSQQGRDEPLFFMKVTIIVVLDKSVIMFLVMIVVIMVKKYFWNKSGCSSELVPESPGFPGCTFPPWLTSTAGWTSLGVIFGIIIICCNFSFPINSQSFASNSFGPIYFVFLHTSTTIIIIINITVGWFAAGPRASGWGDEAHKVGERTNLTIWEYNSPTPKQISIKDILNCDIWSLFFRRKAINEGGRYYHESETSQVHFDFLFPIGQLHVATRQVYAKKNSH